MRTLQNNIIFIGYFFTSLVLFLYSFTQVDLNLTLSTVNIWQSIQKSFQYIGYYQRPFSTAIYISIVVFLYGLYIVSVQKVRSGDIGLGGLWRIVFCLCIILVLSYPAFSYDIFNYMFTAKTVLVYHKNPYEVLPMQFSTVDPWVGVMRWIHLPSAYTPLWIALSLPAYFFGFETFLLILWNFKIIAVCFYLLAAKGIYAVLKSVEPDRAAFGMALFALNPLVIIESLVSGHNDIVMMAIAIWSMVYFVKKKQYFFSWWVLAISIGMKFMTLFLIPGFVLRWHRGILFAGMLFGLVLLVLEREILPWYFVWIMPFVAIMPNYRTVSILSGAFSLGLLLRYTPYLYYGNWNAPVPILKWWVTVVPVAVGVMIALRSRFTQALYKR